jgi:hypothetical protein
MDIKKTPATSSLFELYIEQLRKLIEAYKNKDAAAIDCLRSQVRMSRQTLHIVS